MQHIEIIGFVTLAMIAGCGENTPPPQKPAVSTPTACRGPAECGTNELCMHGRCVPGPDLVQTPSVGQPHLVASPLALSFGTLAVGTSRRLPVLIANDGDVVATLSARVEPPAPVFRIEPLGTGPFWVRPGRSRAIYVTYGPTAPGAAAATLVIESNAEPLRIPLSGN